MVNRPSVTCVMVTGHQPARRQLALRSIESFRRQTYAERELLIINEGEPLAVADANAREVLTDKGQSLGQLRNLGLQHAAGDLVLQWDDDDWHGPARIGMQVNAGWPSLLQQELIVHQPSGRFAAVRQSRGFHGTILHARDTLARYKPLSKGEDTAFLKHFRCRPIDNSAADYIRTYHGANTWEEQHFERFLELGRAPTNYETRVLTGVDWLTRWLTDPRPRPCRSAAHVKAALGELKWMNYTNGLAVERLVLEHRLRDVLEIGTLHGVGTCYFAATGARVTTVDLPHSKFNSPRVEDTLAACGLEARIVRQASHQALAEAIAAGQSYDLIYVDGSHLLGDALADVYLGDRLLRPGGWLILDDLANPDFPDVQDVWRRLPPHYERREGPTPNWGVARKAS